MFSLLLPVFPNLEPFDFNNKLVVTPATVAPLFSFFLIISNPAVILPH
jgi:hypothetical protein